MSENILNVILVLYLGQRARPLQRERLRLHLQDGHLVPQQLVLVFHAELALPQPVVANYIRSF